MAIIVSNLALPFNEPPQRAVEAALRRLSKPNVKSAQIVRKAVDARKRSQIQFVYSVAVECENEDALIARFESPQIKRVINHKLEIKPAGRLLSTPPVIAGFGPAGMFAGLLLARSGYCPVILERGAAVDERVQSVEHFWKTGELDARTNVQFGEGGAGTFSDGKLNTRIGDARCRFVLEEFVKHGAPPEILYQAKPHIGTDLLRGVVKAIRKEIIELGGEIRFLTQLTGLNIKADKLAGVVTSSGDIEAEVLILAPGHSARDTFDMLRKNGVAIEAKAFSVGARIEHLQKDIDTALYGAAAGNSLLPPGEYALSMRQNGRGVYTFCMCPGGLVVPAASEENMLVTNGMSEFSRGRRNANAALVVSVSPEDFGEDVFAGVDFQRKLENAAFIAGGKNYRAPAQTVGSFLGRKTAINKIEPSYALGVNEYALDRIFPKQVSDMMREGLYSFGRKLRGFNDDSAVLTGVETRTSSPVRVLRDKSNMQSQAVSGMYPCGEGAGYAGGIMSAAVDGIAVAEKIIAENIPRK